MEDSRAYNGGRPAFSACRGGRPFRTLREDARAGERTDARNGRESGQESHGLPRGQENAPELRGPTGFLGYRPQRFRSESAWLPRTREFQTGRAYEIKAIRDALADHRVGRASTHPQRDSRDNPEAKIAGALHAT